MTGEEFARIRRRLGLRQGDLARLIGVYQQQISDVETRKSGPTSWQEGAILLFEEWAEGQAFKEAVYKRLKRR